MSTCYHGCDNPEIPDRGTPARNVEVMGEVMAMVMRQRDKRPVGVYG